MSPTTKSATDAPTTLDPWLNPPHPSVRPQPPEAERPPASWHLLIAAARPVIGGALVTKLEAHPRATRQDARKLANEIWDETRSLSYDGVEGHTVDRALSAPDLGGPTIVLEDAIRRLITMRDHLPALRLQHATLGALIQRFERLHLAGGGAA